MADRSLIIRRGYPRDLDLLMDMVAEYCAVDGHIFDVSTVRNGILPLLESYERGLVWMICPDGEPIGYAAVTWGWSVESGGRDALMDEIYLRVRGKGYGTRAISEIMRDLKARGIGRAFLETEIANEDARRLYRQLGFETEESIWMSRYL